MDLLGGENQALGGGESEELSWYVEFMAVRSDFRADRVKDQK